MDLSAEQEAEQVAQTMTATTGGLAPTPPNDVTKKLTGIGTFATTDASEVTYTPAGTSSVQTTVKTALDYIVNVTSFGADNTGVSDSSAAFQNAVNALPTLGGRIRIGAGTWKLATKPTWGTDTSIYWDIDPGAIFTGTAGSSGAYTSFPAALNPAQHAFGPWVLANPPASAIPGGISGGYPTRGLQAAAFEIWQRHTDFPSYYVGLIASAATTDNVNIQSEIWSANLLCQQSADGVGRITGVEQDMSCASTTNTKITGYFITGAHKIDAGIGYEIFASYQTGYTGNWITGFQCGRAIEGLNAWGPDSGTYAKTGEAGSTALRKGVTVNMTSAMSTDHLFGGKQITNGTDCIYIRRKADITPTGWFMRLLSSAAAVLFSIDITGAVTAPSYSTGTAKWSSGAGTPEGLITGAVGSLFTRTDGGASTTLYVKESGTGNTGWVAK